MAHLKLSKVYQQYPEYKDSGVEWLGKIPIAWGCKKARKFISKIEPGIWGNDTKKDDNDIKCLRVADFDFDKMTYRPVATIRNNLNIPKNKILKNGDILIEKSGGGDKQPVGRAIVFEGEERMTCANFIDIIRLKNVVLPRMFAYQLFTTYRAGLNIKSIKQNTGIQNLDTYSYFNEIFPVVDPPIQKRIVRFLDNKRNLIDQIIEKKQRLIELLREKRTAFINYEILEVGGVNDKIKNHVLVSPTKKVVSTTDLEEMVSFVPMEALTETGELEIQERRYEEVKEGYTYFRNGDVVIAKITPCYENGKVGIMKGLKNGFGFGTTEFMVLRPKDHITADYLYYLVFSDRFRKTGEVEMRGTAGQKRVTSTFVRNYEFLLPSIEKQNKIVRNLRIKLKLFDEIILKIAQSIEILQEFRISLISKVVTGKIII